MVGADLSRDRPPHGSQHPFGSGQSLHPLSEPLQPGVRFLRDPLPATDAPDFTTGLVAPRSATRLRASPVPRDEHESGGPHLSAGDRFVSVSPPSRETSDHAPFGSSLSVDLARSCLTAFTSGSLALVLRPSLAPHPDFDFQNHTMTLAGIAYPLGWLRCQCARHEVVTDPALHLGYWRLNARLHAGSRLSNNSSHGLRRVQPDPGLPEPTARWPYSIRVSPDPAIRRPQL